MIFESEQLFDQLSRELPSPWIGAFGQPSGSLWSVLAEPLQQLIDDLPEQIALLDPDGLVVAANRAWQQVVTEYGYLEALPPNSYREFCRKKAAEGYEPAIQALAALDDISSGRRSYWQLVYNGRDQWQGRDYQISFHRIKLGGRGLILVTRFDLTEIIQLRRVRDDFANLLIEGQAIERQRLGRELHDSGSQLLTAIGLLLGRLKHQSVGSEALGVIEEMEQLLAEVHREIRSISFLAHPPSIRKLGLPFALKSLIEGFGRRTGLEVSFDIIGENSKLSELAESAIYRLAQEALSNVHRHARATRVRIQLSFRRSATHLTIADNGTGMAPDKLARMGGEGVGLAGMRSRLAEMGGRLSVLALAPGTAFIGSVPAVSRT